MANEFEDGTVVQLKSGGPLMTIEKFGTASQQYHCEWFIDGEVKSGFFKATSLRVVPEDKGDW